MAERALREDSIIRGPYPLAEGALASWALQDPNFGAPGPVAKGALWALSPLNFWAQGPVAEGILRAPPDPNFWALGPWLRGAQHSKFVNPISTVWGGGAV